MTTSGVIRLTAAPKRRAAQRAYTIIELLAVVALLGVAATIILPTETPGESRKLDLAAVEIVNAIRFARSEAMRTRNTIGFQLQQDPKQVSVFSIDIENLPPTITFDVFHPVDKNEYLRRFDEQPSAFYGDIGNSSTYRGTCNTGSEVYFDAEGIPWCADPVDVLLEQFDVELTLGSSSLVVTLNGITGRVTVQ